MWTDPIVAETRSLRDEYARQFDYDADAIFEDLIQCAVKPRRSGRGYKALRTKFGFFFCRVIC